MLRDCVAVGTVDRRINIMNSGPTSNPIPTGVAKSPEVAKFLNTTVNQLARLRAVGLGPQYCKFGRSVRYRWVDVYRYVEANVHPTASEAEMAEGQGVEE